LWLAREIEDGTQILRHLVEALGGALAVQARGDEDLTVAANFWICD
jgi:hypothetical protein